MRAEIFKSIYCGWLCELDSQTRRIVMTKEKFSEILKEYDFSDEQIEILSKTKPTNDLNEKQLRKSAKFIGPIKDGLVQA